MRIRRRLVKFLFWGMFLVCSILAGGAWFTFSYFTDSKNLVGLIRFHAKDFLPGSTLDIRKVELATRAGEITIRDIYVRQPIDGALFPTLYIPWLQVKLSFWRLLHGEKQAREVIVSRPTLQLCRRKDGTYNLQGLLANPWPATAIKDPPPIIIKNGTIELVVDDDHASRSAGIRPEPQPGKEVSVVDPAGATAKKKVAILREVMLTVTSGGPSNSELEFKGEAKGDTFENLSLEGSIDIKTGKVTLEGDLSRLTLSEMVLERIPREFRPAVAAIGLKGGEVNLEVEKLEYDPKAEASQRLRYEATARLSGGVWECKNLPFTVSELSAQISARNGELTIEHAEGHNGMTMLRVAGKLSLGDFERTPFDIRVDVVDLILDDRLRARTPPKFDELWDIFKPKGKVDTAVRVVREKDGGPVGVGATVICRDVSGIYRHFAYPIEHMTGVLKLEQQRISVDFHTFVGSKPVTLKGTIDNPGPDAIVRLNIEAEAVPVDQTLLDAIPPHVRKVVNQFQPSGSAKGSIKIFRKPTVGPMVRPEGDFDLQAVIDLKERCSIRWAGLPYPVRNLTGRLTILPDLWKFENMRGENGQSLIAVSGQVQKLPLPLLPNGEPPLKVEVAVQAENLLFNDELRDSLQPAWRKTWDTINPTGATNVKAWVNLTKIGIEPNKSDLVKIEIRPRPKSNIRLVVPTLDPNFKPVLPMEDVNGLFEFKNDVVTMTGASFEFRGAPVTFDHGTVFVKNNGQFKLSVGNLWVKQIRFDHGFRKIMPPMMGSFAERLDDGKTFTARGDLDIGWSGVLNEPAWCRWKNTKAFFNGNAVKAGIPLENFQGVVEQVNGWSDGKTLEVAGKLNLASVNILGQQITGLETKFSVNPKFARMEEMHGALLGGSLSGSCWISIDSPSGARYGTQLLLQNAGLEQYGLTVPGRQTYRGQLNAGMDIHGFGTDVHSIQGNGWAKVTQGDLGELPVFFQFAKFVNEKYQYLRGKASIRTETAFDQADVKFQVHDGLTTLSEINFTGNAFRLLGAGTLDPQGNLDIGLRLRYGRGFYLPLISDAINDISGEIVGVRVQGSVSNPTITLKLSRT